MKKLLTLVFVSTLGFTSVMAQEKLSGHITAGLYVPYTDLTGSSFPGAKPNAFAGIGLGYIVYDNLRLRGDFIAGSMNGDNSINYSETAIYEGMLSGQYNVLSWFNKTTRWELNANLGLGALLYNAKLYSLDTRELIVESPFPGNGRGGLSLNPLLAAGFELSIPITRNLKLQGGYNQRIVLFQDLIDAFEGGSGNDSYGSLNIGLGFYFDKRIKKGKMEIDKRKYNQMLSSIDSLKKIEPKEDTEKIARMEMANQEKDLKIQSLQDEVDSLRANVATVPATPENKPDAEAILGDRQYRIVVASLPTQAMAQRWIDNSELDNTEMVIAYVEAVNSYRVIYKSYNSVAAAKKDLQEVKATVADAWIANF